MCAAVHQTQIAVSETCACGLDHRPHADDAAACIQCLPFKHQTLIAVEHADISIMVLKVDAL